MGELITITGTGFGQKRGFNTVSIAGNEPTSSSYEYWSDTSIRVRTPLFGDSGLVFVNVGKKKSNSALFTKRDSIPILVNRKEGEELPTIAKFSPAKPSPGSLLIITGKNLGETRGSGAVSFTWAAEEGRHNASVQQKRTSIEALAEEYAYELWSDREIRVRVPESAKSGPVIIRNRNGAQSKSSWLEIDNRLGSRNYKDKRSYSFSYSVNFQIHRASKPNRLSLWMPSPIVSNSQNANQILNRSLEPIAETNQGYSLYQFDNLSTGNNQTILVQRAIDVWAVETKVNTDLLRKTKSSPLLTTWTLANDFIPADNPELIALANEIAGKAKNDWLRAKAIYDWILSDLFISSSNENTSVLEDVQRRQSDPCNAALIFCTLARALDIPAVPIAGFLIARNRDSRPHWWAEFWLDDFGWVPVDPSMGSGTIPPHFVNKDQIREYYFGNMDSQRIAFSRGVGQLPVLDRKAKTASRQKAYALQNIWEEALGNLEAYSTLWSELSVSGIY